MAVHAYASHTFMSFSLKEMRTTANVQILCLTAFHIELITLGNLKIQLFGPIPAMIK